MKRRIALSGKAQKISTIAIVTAIAGVVGLGGLAITSGAVNAAEKSTTGSSSSSSSSSSKTTGSTTTKPTTTSTQTTTPTTTTPTTQEPVAATPDTGLFTGDGEFTKADGIILLTGGLAVVLGAYAICHNRKEIFRGRVKFDQH